jgi:hypothetical protein
MVVVRITYRFFLMTAINRFKKLVKRKIQKRYVILGVVGIFIGLVVFGVIRIFALEESTWNVGDGGDTTLVTGSGDNVVITATSVTLAEDDTWLGLGWDYRKDLKVENISDSVVLPEGDTVTVVVDSSSLESVQDDCDDLRVGYIENGSVREIPRDIVLGSGSTSCLDSIDTRVSFKLERELSNPTVEGYVEGDEYDDSYVLFYGNGTVDEPSYPGEKYLSFDGGDKAYSSQIGPFNSFTYTAWVKVDECGGTKTIINGDSRTWNSFTIEGGYLNFYAYQLNVIPELQYRSNIPIVCGQWNFVAFTFNRNDQATFYINGESAGATTVVDAAPLKGVSQVGWRSEYVSSYFIGGIDEVRIYSKNLSDEDISNLFFNTKLPTQSLEAYWNMDFVDAGIISDLSGNGRNLTLSSTEGYTPTYTDLGTSVYDISQIDSALTCPLNGSSTCVDGVTPTTETGAIRYSSGGSALEFDGYDDYSSISSVNGISTGNTPHTISAWIKPEGDHLSRQWISLLGGTTGGNHHWLYNIDGTVTLGVWGGSSNSQCKFTIEQNQWNHIVSTFDGTNLDCYKNGALADHLPSVIFNLTSNTFRVATPGVINESYFRGMIDDLYLYPRALSSEEVQGLYNNENVSLYSEPPNLLYHFDENGLDPRLSTIQTDLETTLGVSGNGVAYDSSGNGNHGLIVGAKYTNDTPIGNSGVMSHEGVFIEEGTTNKVLNPSFENIVYDKYWSSGYENLDLSASTFTAKMAKRNGGGPFAGGVTVQGISGAGKGDILTYDYKYNRIEDFFYHTLDFSQGTLTMWVTPSWNGSDDVRRMLFSDYSGIRLEKRGSDLVFQIIPWTLSGSYNISDWQEGETYLIIVRWDTNNTIDGSNHISFTVNNITAFTANSTDYRGFIGGTSPLGIGGYRHTGDYPANANIEGLTIYRRVLFDGTYGTDIGNGNEIEQIYNSGSGKDPTEITGSWDVVFCLPTDGSTGELTSDNQAWSMPHSSNLLGTGGYMMGDSASVDGWDNYSSNKIVNSSFEDDLSNWNYQQEYILRDEFDEDGPITLVDGVSSLSNGGVVTPEMGGEILTNGNMETGDPPDNWTPIDSTLSAYAEERTGGTGTQSLLVTPTGTGYAYAEQQITNSVGDWIYANGWVKTTDSNYVGIRVGGSMYYNYYYNWTKVDVVARATSNNINVGVRGGYYSDQFFYADDFSAKVLSLPSLFSTVSESTNNIVVSTDVTLTKRTPAGLVLNLDNASNPQNFVIAYHDGTNIVLEKNVNGTYTTLINTAATYSAGATLKVIRKDNVYKLVYNGVQIGSDQTISDVSIVDNTLQGIFSTYSGNTFDNFKITTNLDGTLASDGVSERSLTDIESGISIVDGDLSFASNKATSTSIDYPLITRGAGRVIVSEVTPSNTGFKLPTLEHLFYGAPDGLLQNDPPWLTVGGYTNGVSYKVALVMRTSGVYYYIRGGTEYPEWTLINIGSIGSNDLTPYYGYGGSKQAYTSEFISVPNTTWLPIPLAYDTFSTDTSTQTESVGPDGQTTPVLDWNRNNWQVSDGKISCNPSLGEELWSTGASTFESGTYSWIPLGTNIISNENNTLRVDYVDSGYGAEVDLNLTGDLISDLGVGKWYRLTLDAKSSQAGPSTYINSQIPDILRSTSFSTDSFSQIYNTFRAGGSDHLKVYGMNSTASTVWYDNLSLKEINLADTFATVDSGTESVYTSVDIDSKIRGVQAGLVVNLDSAVAPTSGMVAYFSDTQNGDKRIMLSKFTNGSNWTNLINASGHTFTPGETLSVITDKVDASTLKVRVYYNNALVGTEQTITDPEIINNTNHGLFSTYEGNTFDNFAIWPRGTDGEYNDIPAEDLTALRSSNVSYDGVSSVLLNAGSSNDSFTQTHNLVDGYTYNLTAYAYTDGSAVTSSDIELYYDTSTIDTTYTDMGSGWYKLTGTLTGISGNKEVGVRVKADKSVYVDGIEISEKTLLTDDLVAYWNLNETDGTRYDSVGSNDLTDNNTVTQATGKVGSSAQFSSANSEYLSINDNEELSLGDMDFTVSAWVYMTDKTNNAIIEKGSGWAGESEYSLYYRDDVDRFRFHVGHGVYDDYAILNADSLGSPELNTWYHIVAWHDAVDDTINIQVNDGPVDSASYSGGSYNSGGLLRVGGSFSADSMDGRIDSVGFWKRKLTPEERTYLYNSGVGTEYPFINGMTDDQKIFSGGYYSTSYSNSGIYKDINITTGQDIVLRGIANSDGTSIPRLSVYDVTNDIEIGYLDGSSTSTKDNPDNLLFTAEGTLESKATGSITLTTNPVDGDIVEIGGILYTFKDDISTPATGEILVKIGLDSTESASNLVLAISDGGVLGTNYSYGTGSVAHTLVDATSDTNIVSLVAKSAGLAGNDITLSKLGTNISVSDTSLLGGKDNCSTLRIRLLNSSTTLSTVNWHQVEVYNNLINNPSFEGVVEGDIVPRGWGNSSLTPEDTIFDGNSFTGSYSLGYNTSANNRFARQTNGVAQGYCAVGATGFGDGSKTVSLGPGTGGVNWYQSGLDKTLQYNFFSTLLEWKRIYGVLNTEASSLYTYVYPSGIANDIRYIDDVYGIELNDVSLGVTPASYETSQTDDGGVVVNGMDTMTVPLNLTDPNNGVIRFDFIPTWTYPNIYPDGTTYYIFDTNTESNISLSGNTSTDVITFTINGTSVTWGTPVLNAGERYSVEVSYDSDGTTYLKINGNIVASTTGFTGFTTSGPSTLYLGTTNTGTNKYDATFYPYPSSTISSNTNTSYLKYGNTSVSIVGGNANDEYLTELDLGNTNNHTITAYVYNNTSGSAGGTVDDTVAQLIFNNTPVTTTYTDEGGGWWRLSYTGAGVVGTTKYGIQVKPTKSIFLDAIQVEEKAYATTYADGSLGTGYSWGGTADESESVREYGDLNYNVPLSDSTNGSISMWYLNDNAKQNGRLIRFPDGKSVRWTPTYLEVDFTGTGTINCPNITMNTGEWVNVVVNWDTQNQYINCCTNGICSDNLTISTTAEVGSYFYVGRYGTDYGYINSALSDLRIFEDPLTPSQVTQLYNQGMSTYNTSASSSGKYATEGVWTSQVIDLGNNGQWGMSPALQITDNKGSDNIIYKTRTSPDNSTWTEYEGLTTTETGYNFISPPNRYMQIQATLQSTTQTTTPEFNSMTFNYVQDTIKPTTNASNIQYYSTAQEGQLQTANDWTNIDQPYISWDPGVDNIDGSGLRGYCLYLGQDPAADPAQEAGLLSITSPIHTSDTNCGFIIDTPYIDLSNSAYHSDTWLSSSNSDYYFKVKAVDYTGNVYGTTADDAEVYTFKFDNTLPNNPKGISAPQEYQREIESFRIYWAPTGTSAASDTHSGVKGYQYRIGETGTWYGAGHTGTEDCTDLLTNTDYTLQTQFEGQEIGDELNIGENVFYIRTWDNICNVTTTYATAILKYSADAPSKPTNLTVDPIENTVNEFSFTWDIPETFSGEQTGLQYCYTVNTLPSQVTCNWTSNTTLAPDAYANQPGENVFYIVSKDEAGNVNYDDYNLVRFTANTSAPGIVQSLEISDISIKSSQNWKLALSWETPEETGAGVSTYQLFRSEIEDSNYSEDPSTFSYVGTTSGESYTDTNLEQKEYYYTVKACDNANNCSAGSNTVHMLPTGRYYVPAEIVTQPKLTHVSTRSATISWVTERGSDSKIQFGLSSGEYFEEEIANSEQVVEHSLKLNNLEAGTTYFYKAKWTDEDGNTGMTDELSFKTEPPPSVKDVDETYVNLDNAAIRFTTKGSSKVKIYYGPDASLTNSTELETSAIETTYTVTLTGLEDGTKYFYKINLFDKDGNEYNGTVLLDFVTPPRPEVYNVAIQEKYGTAQPTVEITWESNTEVNSIVRYYPSGREDLVQNKVDIEMVKGDHMIELSGLLPTTTYIMTVEGTDRLGNSAQSDTYTFTTATDTRPPQIYDLRVDKSVLSSEVQPDRERSAQLVVSWKTDEPSTSQVAYDSGLGDEYTQKTNVESNLKTDHVVIISNLSPSTVYHLQAVSEDSATNSGKSSKLVAVTPKATNTVFEVVIESLGNVFNFLR